MTMILLRLLAYAAAVYGFFLVACPDWDGRAYHAVSIGLVAAAALGLAIFLRVFDLGSRAFKVLVELAFAAAVFAYFGYTLPLKSGTAPLRGWVEGKTPTRADAENGLRRLGLDPGRQPAATLVRLFP